MIRERAGRVCRNGARKNGQSEPTVFVKTAHAGSLCYHYQIRAEDALRGVRRAGKHAIELVPSPVRNRREG